MTEYTSLIRVMTAILRHAREEGKMRGEHEQFENQTICRVIREWGDGYAFGEVHEKMIEATMSEDITKIYDAIIELLAVCVVWNDDVSSADESVPLESVIGNGAELSVFDGEVSYD